MKTYNVGDFVTLDFIRCDPNKSNTPGGLYFPFEWRDSLQGREFQIVASTEAIGKDGKRWYEIVDCPGSTVYIDEYCIAESNHGFDTDGLLELI